MIRLPRRYAAGLLAALGVTVLLATATACGIRPTDVPVDAGPAPTRATCDAPPGEDSQDSEVFLVCGSHVNPVRRPLSLGATAQDGAKIAGALLSELQSAPGRNERDAGFTSEVPADLRVSGPVGGDPAGTLRLSERPAALPATALVQIICTFAANESLGDGWTVMLGGPPDGKQDRPKTYACSTATRASPEEAQDTIRRRINGP
ncbi:hypothetical protein [Streptomyces avicenniae]|uniref:hypothetical protein n=1 Tax=Streptomyces avicenniae TaxID=500153 RepID=UPI000699B69D|nr:hypothetical protein [Streptomyces avicenniae]